MTLITELMERAVELEVTVNAQARRIRDLVSENSHLIQTQRQEPRKVMVQSGTERVRGFFHGWSTYAKSSQQSRDLVFTSPIAIVELTTGKVITPDPSDVTFVNPTEWRDDAAQKDTPAD